MQLNREQWVAKQSPKTIALECVSRWYFKLFFFLLIVSGYSLESKDELVDALPTLKQRAAENDANILFSVANDLSKVSLVLFWFIDQLSIDVDNSYISRRHVLWEGLKELRHGLRVVKSLAYIF